MVDVMKRKHPKRPSHDEIFGKYRMHYGPVDSTEEAELEEE